MKIDKKYLLFWDKDTKLIQNDYTVPINQDANFDFAASVEWFASDDLTEIIDKIVELDLLTPDEI